MLLKNGPGLSPRFLLSSNLGVLFFCLKSALLKYRAGRHYMLTCVTTYMHAVAAALGCLSANKWPQGLLQERDALGQLRDLLQQR